MGCTDCHADGQAAEAIFTGRWYAYPPLRNALIAGLITGITFAVSKLVGLDHGVEIFLYSVAIVIGGQHWMREGLAELLREGRVDIELLMLAATAGSIALGMWDEAATLVFLYGAAEGLEHYTYIRTRRSIRGLLELAPRTARRLTADGNEETIPAAELRAGDLFAVRPGETVATDGEIVSGRSTLDESAVTGESMPVQRAEGDEVFAGTLNREGALTVRATTSFEDNTLSRMIHLVEEAQERKGRRQLFIERFGRWYTPAVLVTAILFVVIPMIAGADLRPWATRAIVLLVAAAPCALIMSTPVGIAAGITRAGRAGVLIKGGVHLEDLGRIRLVAFDKTGTLTEGRPVVTDLIPLTGDETWLLRVAAAVERQSEHPLGEAIVRRAREAGLEPLPVTDFRAIPGAGVTGLVAGERVYVGSPRLCAELGVSGLEDGNVARLQAEGKTVVCVTGESGPLGLIAIGDPIRPSARHAVEDLHAMGLRTVMLTGDNEGTARAIAAQAGIDEVRAHLKPEDKIAAVEELEARYGAAAVVGDGINDAPALARATSGIAMGVGGTDAAIEAADCALIGEDLTLVPFAIRLGRRAQAIGTQNIVFALTVLAILIPLAVIGTLSVPVAVLTHEASELLAVANGLRVGTRQALRCPRGNGEPCVTAERSAAA